MYYKRVQFLSKAGIRTEIEFTGSDRGVFEKRPEIEKFSYTINEKSQFTPLQEKLVRLCDSYTKKGLTRRAEKLLKTATENVMKEEEKRLKGKNVCQFCNWDIPKKEFYNMYSENPVCDECFERCGLSYCGECGDVIDSENPEEYHVHDCEAYCTECYEDIVEPMELTEDTDVTDAPSISVEGAKKKGYKLVNDYMPEAYTHHCEIGWRVSGDGRNDGRSLGLEDIKKEVKKLQEKHGTVYASITEAGQFQVYVGLFIKNS